MGDNPGNADKSQPSWPEDIDLLIQHFTSQLDRSTSQSQTGEIIAKLKEGAVTFAETNQTLEGLYDAVEVFTTAGNLVGKHNFKEAQWFYEKAIGAWNDILHSPHMVGNFHDIAEAKLNLARLFGEKMHLQDEANQCLHEAIIILAREAELLETFGELQKAAHIYNTAGELFLKVGNEQAAIEAFGEVITYGKQGFEPRVVFNATESLVKIFQQRGNIQSSHDLLEDTIEFFLSKLDAPEVAESKYLRAEIYQVLRKLSLRLNNEEDYLVFTKKEANEYISQAKNRLEENAQEEAAAFYRGAAFCLREIDLNIDGGSCFHLAGNIFKEIGHYADAAQNYLDAAREFEKAKQLHKAWELQVSAGKMLEKADVRSEAADAYSYAFDLLDGLPGTEHSVEKGELGLRVSTLLSQLAHLQSSQGEYAFAGTLFLEAAVFLRRIGADWETQILSQILQSKKSYNDAFFQALQSDPSVSATLWGAIAAVGAWLTQDRKTPRVISQALVDTPNLPSRMAGIAFLENLEKSIGACKISNLFGFRGPGSRFFAESPELKKICLFLEENIEKIV